MESPALPTYGSLGNVNDSPYSRILEEIDSEARRPKSSPKEEDSDGKDDDARSSNGTSSEDEAEDADADDTCCKSDDVVADLAVLEEVVSEEHKDLAQLQKKQAWLRGGGRDTSDTASTKSSTRKKVRQPSLLEALLLPKTHDAAHRRASASKANASVRPHVRRASTTDLAKPARPSSIADSSSTTTRSPRPMKSSPKPKGGSRDSVRLSLSVSTKKTPPSPVVKVVECITCLSDDIPRHKAALLECKHYMCHKCLKRLFTLSTTDPQLMPPRCCTENVVPLKHVEKLFDKEFKVLWNRKYSEYTTKNRLYCPTKNCGLWIKPKYIETDRATGRKMGKCKECKTKVCKKCGLKWHGGRECDNDEATKRVIDMGKEQGWQRCYSCRTMVQLSEGCNHMKCRCNAEFCMVCGQKWKTCDCPWFNLPDELGVDGFLDPVQDVFMPLGPRMGGLPPPPPLPGGWPFGLGQRPLVNIPPPPPLFRDRRDMPLDPLNPGEIFRPPGLERPRSMRRRSMPAAPRERDDQEAADEELARRLQNLEFADAEASTGMNDDDNDNDAARQRRRASRRARRNPWAIPEEGGV